MVTGSFFCICLERPKYFYIAADKAVYLKMNSESVFSHRETVYSVRCLSVSRVCPQLSHGDAICGGLEGVGSARPAGGPGASGPNCRSAPGCLGCERLASPTLAARVPAPGMRVC